MPKLLIGSLLAYAARLRFSTLCLIGVALLIVNVLLPEVVPFEVLFGLGTVLLSSWKKRSIPPPP